MQSAPVLVATAPVSSRGRPITCPRHIGPRDGTRYGVVSSAHPLQGEGLKVVSSRYPPQYTEVDLPAHTRTLILPFPLRAAFKLRDYVTFVNALPRTATTARL